MQGCGGSSASAGGAGRGNPPATPTGLAATPSNHQVSLTWNTATTASSYNVKRSTTSGGPYTRVANATVSNDTDTGLANGTTYYYVVSAVNANGESANSREVSGTPNIPPPGVPTGLTATAANLQVALAWNAITGATSYNVKRATTTGGPYAKVGSSTVATYTETGLSNGTAYYYVVSAVNANGESGNSTEASATPASVSPDVTVIVDPTQTNPSHRGSTASRQTYGRRTVHTTTLLRAFGYSAVSTARMRTSVTLRSRRPPVIFRRLPCMRVRTALRLAESYSRPSIVLLPRT